MKFTLEENNKFSCISLSGASIDDSFPELDLGNGIWALPTPPFALGDPWNEWMGSLKTDAFNKSNFVIIAKQRSSKPQILDEENKSLNKIVYSVFHMLLMHGVPAYDNGFNASGAMIDGKIGTREFGSINVHYRLTDVLPFKISTESIETASKLAVKLRTLYSVRNLYLPFKRGFHAWLRGIKEKFDGESLHQYVRAVEVFIHPPIGETRKKFIHRCQTFTVRSKQSQELLGEIYDLRSRTEHMQDRKDVLNKYDEPKRNKIAMLRTYQSFLLASHVYRKILGCEDIFSHFSTDDSIDGFWRKKEHEQNAIWGKKIDLESEAQKMFRQ